ncbi:bile acid:sodium symporter [Verticiella sediminum]|uniref:Bile acid:sodium symporter n=1 Tax=Verticiella sediminum TaxID=1247510 RepID=A0A556B0U1_9BURK|nr:bile acid:sodium symporter family protein [Verticiella sediminum]TSH98807.1 bile acid:sodium symporter [Verticiella sediminum]
MQALLKKLRIDPYLLLLAGTVALAAVLPVQGRAAEVFGYVTYAAIALLFFLYGAKLSLQSIGQGLLHWRLQGLVFLFTYAVFPLLGLGIAFLGRGHVADELLTGLVYVSLLPSTVQSSIAFTSIARGNVPGALTSASVSNLVGVVITPLLVAAVLGAHTGGFNLQSLVDIAVQLLLPFAVGQLCRRWLAPVLKAHPRLTLSVDRGAILLVVYSAFSAGMVAGIWSSVRPADLAWVIGLCVLLLAIVLWLTTFLGRHLGFNRADRITLAFCGSKKSMATGIPMAGILFAGPAVPLIVLPLMLFHQIQLFACAFLAQRWAREADLAEAREAADGAPAARSPAA